MKLDDKKVINIMEQLNQEKENIMNNNDNKKRKKGE